MNVVNRVTSSDGTSIAFERSGAGPALILVDAAGNYRDFRPLRAPVERLAADFTVYAYDRRGRGASTDALPDAVERELDDLAALIVEAGGSAFVYDCRISDATSLRLIRSVTAATLVIDSQGSGDAPTGMAAAVVEALPNGTQRSLAGGWHGVPDEALAPVLTEFLQH
jgi:hypothetical protein